jgi:AAA family ATP:ADP antiporter
VTASAADERAHTAQVALSFAYFALLLAAYYLLRPVRDALAAGLGSGTIKYLSSVVFIASAGAAALYGWLVARVSRRRLVPGLYLSFCVQVLGFAWLFSREPASRLCAESFYVWVAVFNLLAVAAFWSFMADLWRHTQSPRYFARIAAGGSLGGLLGPLAAHQFAASLGPVGLAQCAAALLLLAAGVGWLLTRGIPTDGFLAFDEPVGGGALAGLRLVAASPYLRGIALLVAGGSLLGMFVYIEVAKAAAALYPDTALRTAYFAQRDLWVNGLSLAVQWTIAPVLMRRFGIGAVLMLVCGCVATAFCGLALWPSASLLLGINVLMRTLEFGLGKPSRDVLYTVVDAESKYKAKNVIDTVFYRACDTASGWLHALLVSVGAGLPILGGIGLLIGAPLALLGRRLGVQYATRARAH